MKIEIVMFSGPVLSEPKMSIQSLLLSSSHSIFLLEIMGVKIWISRLDSRRIFLMKFAAVNVFGFDSI